MAALTGPTLLRIPDYELVRLVGRGAYGEVWMARNALGSLRAVKVVWRRNFEEERPYEREFHGIRKFEPVSRKHEGLVDVYHVGRNNDDGYFYYVMELADDASPVPATRANGEYRPLTLREEIRARGRMTVGRTLEIGAKLASALDHLHQAGLVHRDVKPSNIIFVGGSPKLADIGLVAGISDARSYVGTEGFVPPEGPGSPAADIYSLGKVLYEMSTGLDRNDFPKLPPVGGASGIDAREFSEFNEVLLRACEPSEKGRYRTAAELFGDLVFLQGGKSLRRVRALERRTAFLTRLGIVAAALAVLASAGYYGSFKQIQRAVRAERQAIAHVELLEMQKAEELFQRDDSGGALARLAHILRANPTNRIAMERLMAALTWLNFPLPTSEPFVPPERARMAAFRPDGLEVVAGGASGQLFAWDTATTQLSWSSKLTPSDIIGFEWNRDQSQIAVATRDDGILFDVINRQPVPLGIGPESQLTSLRFSADGRWLLSGTQDGKARIWDSRTARPTGPTISHGSQLFRALFRPNEGLDRGLIATAGFADGAARLWNPKTAQPVSLILRHGKRINEMRFSPDGRSLGTAADDATARLWTLEGREFGRFAHRAAVTDLAFSPDGGRLATASEDGTAILWDIETRQAIGAPMRHRASVRTIEFSPDGLKLATSADDNTIRIWDATTAAPFSEPMRHSQSVVSVNFAPRGERLLTTASSPTESSLWIWKTSSRSAKNQLIIVTGNKRSAHILPDLGRLAIAADRTLRLWSVKNPQQSEAAVDLGVPVDFFNLSANGLRTVIVSGNQAWIWDLPTQEAVKGPITHDAPVIAAELSPDASQGALATAHGQLTLWNLQSGAAQSSYRCLPQSELVEALPNQTVFTLRFSADGRRLLAACRDKKARLFDATNGRILLELAHDESVLNAEFSPDDGRIVTACADRNARLWDARSGLSIGQPMHHDNDVVMARFSRDGRRVVTASRDWTARVWDAGTGKPVSQPLAHGGPVHVACFSPDGTHVATGSIDGTARLWDAATGLALSDAFRYGGPVETIEFADNGTKLLVVPASGAIHLVETLQSDTLAPDWLPKLAEAVARQRLDGQQQATVTVSADELFRLKRTLDASEATNFVTRWAKWFLSDPNQRPLSANSHSSQADYVAGLLKTPTYASLQETLWLEPANPRGHLLLAQELAGREVNVLTRRDLQEAEWHRVYATRLSPEDEEIADEAKSLGIRITSLRQSISR